MCKLRFLCAYSSNFIEVGEFIFTIVVRPAFRLKCDPQPFDLNFATILHNI